MQYFSNINSPYLQQQKINNKINNQKNASFIPCYNNCQFDKVEFETKKQGLTGKIRGGFKNLLHFKSKSNPQSIKVSKNIVSNLKDSLKSIPQKEEDRIAFITKFMQTNLITGDNIANKNNDCIAKEASKLAQLKDSDLIPALEYSIQVAQVLNKKQPLIFLSGAMDSNFDIYKNIKKRNIIDILEQRKQSLPLEYQEDINTRFVNHLGILTDNEYKKASHLILSVGLKDPQMDLDKLISFAVETDKDTINYMIQHDLFNINNVPYFKNKNDILSAFSQQKTTVEKLNERGLLQPIKERDNKILPFSYALELSFIPDEEWRNVQDRNILGMKDAKGCFMRDCNLKRLADLSNQEWSRIEQRGLIEKCEYCQGNIIELAKLSDSDWNILQKRGISLNKEILYKNDWETLTKISDADWEKGQARGLNPTKEFDKKLLELDDELWNKITSRGLNQKTNTGQYKYNKDSIVLLGELDDLSFERAKQRGLIEEDYGLNNPSFNEEAKNLTQYNDETYKLYFDRGLDELNTSFEVKDKLLNLSDKQFKRIEEDIKPFCDKYSYQLGDNYYGSTPMNGIEKFLDLVYLNDEEYEIAKEFLGFEGLKAQNQLSASEIKAIIKLEADKRERIKQILKLQIDKSLKDEQTNTFISQKRYNLYTLLDLSSINDKQLSRLNSLINLEGRQQDFKDPEILILLSLSDSEFKEASRYFIVPERNQDQFSAIDAIDLSKMTQDEIEKLKPFFGLKANQGKHLDLNQMILVSQLDDKKLQRLYELSNIPKRKKCEQFSFDEILKLLNLSDKEYQRAQKLFFIDQNHKHYNKHKQLSGEEIVKLTEYDDNDIDWLLRIGFLDNNDNINYVKDIIKFKKYCGINSLEQLSKKERCEFLFNIKNHGNLFKYTDAKEYINISSILPKDEREYIKFLNEIKPDLFELAKKHKLRDLDIPTVFEFALFFNETCKDIDSIENLSIKDKRKLLNNLIKANSELFGDEIKELCQNSKILPKNKEEYCALLPKLVKSIGISTNELSNDIKSSFYRTLSSIETPNSRFRTFDFENPNLELNLTYPRNKFVSDIAQILSPLTKEEKNIVCNYFGFELITKQDKNFINGYPVNLNNGVELAQIDDPKLKQIIEKIRPLVKDFSENNQITIKGEVELSKELNNIIKAFPEFITEIGKKQHRTHDYTLDIHSLKVLQGVINNPKYENLPENDKTALKIAALLHDLTKQENAKDITHPIETAYDVYYLLQKLNLSEDEKLKIYQIIKNHNWLEQYNKTKLINNKRVPLTDIERTKIAKDIAFELRKDNSFNMASILTEADMKAVKRDGKFFEGLQDILEQGENEVRTYVKQIKESAIPLPQTKIPKASEIKVDGQKVKDVTTTLTNGTKVTNKVLYLEPDADLSKYGFGENLNSNDLNVLIHALDNGEQSTIFQALGQVDSNALLSTSYVTYNQNNYHAFREQGFILDVDSDDINAGYCHDFGSGFKKDLDLLKNSYLFNGKESKYRNYISQNLKDILGLDNEQYSRLYSKIKNKSITEIDKELPEVGGALRELFKIMEGGKRRNNRKYNEILITRPKIQGVFTYGEQKDISTIPSFLREYAAENDILIVHFGN